MNWQAVLSVLGLAGAAVVGLWVLGRVLGLLGRFWWLVLGLFVLGVVALKLGQ